MSDDIQAANIKLVRSMSENFVAGRLEAVKAHIAEDMVMTLPTGLPYGGVYHGWLGYLDVAAALGEYWTNLSFAPPDYAASGDKVVVMTAFKGRSKSGVAVDMPLTEIWEIHGGLVDRITAFYFDTKAI